MLTSAPVTAATKGQATVRLAEFAASLRYEDLPGPVIWRAKELILDTLGVALAATSFGTGCDEALSVMRGLGGKHDSTILGDGHKIAAPTAAFVNGALAHALNYDAIGPLSGHIGVVCLAAPLATAEARGQVSGREFLTAVCAGSEVAARTAAAIARVGRRGSLTFLAGQVLSYFGCAAGAGRALGLSPGQMHSAFGLALMQAAGSMQVLLEGDPPAKAIYGAFPNHAGVLAALLAMNGLDATCDAFEGRAGLYGVFHGGQFDRDSLIDGIGQDFLFADARCKPWPTSSEIHPFIEGALAIDRHGLDPARIREVRIHGHHRIRPWTEPHEIRARPSNIAVAANSIAFAVAKVLCRGVLTLADFTAEGLAHPEAVSVAGRTTYSFDDNPDSCTVEVVIDDDDVRKALVRLPTELGSQPLPYDRIVTKFHDCCRHAKSPLSSNQVQQVIETVVNLEAFDDMRVLARASCGRRLQH